MRFKDWLFIENDDGDSVAVTDSFWDLIEPGMISDHSYDVHTIPDVQEGSNPEHCSNENFRGWLEFTTGGGNFGGAAGYGTAMHGGIFSKPGEHLNTGAGGAKSKYQATDGDEGDEVKVDPDKMFGMKDRASKRATRERKAKTIDKHSRKSQLVVPRPYY